MAGEEEIGDRQKALLNHTAGGLERGQKSQGKLERGPIVREQGLPLQGRRGVRQLCPWAGVLQNLQLTGLTLSLSWF